MTVINVHYAQDVFVNHYCMGTTSVTYLVFGAQFKHAFCFELFSVSFLVGVLVSTK